MSESAPATTTDERNERDDYDIVVNAAHKKVETDDVSYAQVVQLAYPTPPAPNTIFTVTYRNAAKEPHAGSLVEGQSVEVKKTGTIFNVVPTGKS
jgi:hypothetical protein